MCVHFTLPHVAVFSTRMATQPHTAATTDTTAETSMTELNTTGIYTLQRCTSIKFNGLNEHFCFLYCSGSSQNSLIAVTFSMTVFSFAMLILGFLCGHFSHKYQLCRRSHDHPPKHTSVQHVSEAGADLNEQDPSELEMMDNAAYAPIKHQRRDQLQQQ